MIHKYVEFDKKIIIIKTYSEKSIYNSRLLLWKKDISPPTQNKVNQATVQCFTVLLKKVIKHFSTTTVYPKNKNNIINTLTITHNEYQPYSQRKICSVTLIERKSCKGIFDPSEGNKGSKYKKKWKA